MNAFQLDGCLIVTDQETIDEAQTTGRWIKADRTEEGISL